MNPVALVVMALAVARLTGLITEDKITEGIRERLLDRLDEDSKLAYLITCPWCVSIYLAIPAAVLVWWHSDNPVAMIPAIVLAFSQIAGSLASIGR
jgi:hypothetical protein